MMDFSNHITPHAATVNEIYEHANKGFESRIIICSGQVAVNRMLEHSYDLCVVHGVLLIKYLRCRFFNFFPKYHTYRGVLKLSTP